MRKPILAPLLCLAIAAASVAPVRAAASKESAAQALYTEAQRYYEGRGVHQSFEKAQALFAQAHDQGYTGEDCPLFYYGIGIGQDLKRAFECFQRRHEGGYVAIMYMNGEYVPQDLKAARRALLHSREKPLDRKSLLQEVTYIENAPDPRKHMAVEYCILAGLTPSSNRHCRRVVVQVNHARRLRRYQPVLATLDSGARPLFLAMAGAFERYNQAQAEADCDRLRGQNGQLVTFVASLNAGEARWEKLQDGLAGYQAQPGVTPTAVAAADAALNTQLEKVLQASRDEYQRDLLRAVQQNWLGYLAAQVKFYESVYGPRQDALRVASDVRLRAVQERATLLQAAKPVADSP